MAVLEFTADQGAKASLSVSKSVSAGSTVVFWLSCETTNAWSSSSGSVVAASSHAGTGRDVRAWKAENVAAGTFSATVTEDSATPRNAILRAVEITGAAASGAVEAFDSNNGIGTSGVQAGATGISASSGAVVLSLWCWDRSTALTLAGYTLGSQITQGSGPTVSEYGHKTAGSALTGQTAAGTISPNAFYAAIILSVKPAGGGGTPPGIATETDTALALAGKQIRALGMASETDTALAMVTLAGLPFNTPPYEFGQRTGLDIDDFALYASTALNVSVYAAADVLLASQLFSYTETTGADGRLTRKTHASLTAGSTYIFVAVTTGGTMVAAGRITAT